MELRPYQVETKESIFTEWDKGMQRTLLALPTGHGRTTVFAKVAEECVCREYRALIMTHRGELLEQAVDKIDKTVSLKCATEKAEETCLGQWFRIVVGSAQTLVRQQRLDRFKKDYFDAVIIDETHHCLPDSYQRIFAYPDQAKVFGVMAIPDREDMRNPGSYFQSLAYEYILSEAIKEGFLAPIKALMVPLGMDLSGVGVQAGDFKVSDIGTALDPHLYQIVDEMSVYRKERKIVASPPLVKTSQKSRDTLNEKGFHAAEVNGSSQDQAKVLKDFDEGKYSVLCNNMLLTEGWDCLSVDCIIVLRPTKVCSLYSQMVGRDTRLCEGKDHLLLLDFLWYTDRHELRHPTSLICENEEVAKKMTDDMEEASGMAVDIEEAEQSTAEDVIRQREEVLTKKLTGQRRKKKKLVDPLQLEVSIQMEDLSSHVPAFGWECSPASEKQLRASEKFGIYPDEIGNAGKTSLLLDRLNKCKAEGLATPKQIRFLENRGFQYVGTWQMETARNMISRIQVCGWHIPNGVDP